MNNAEYLQIARNNLSSARAEYDAVLKDRMWLHARIKDAKFNLRSAEFKLKMAEGRGIVNEEVQAEVLFWAEHVCDWLAYIGEDSYMIWPAASIQTEYDVFIREEYNRATNKNIS